MQLDEHQQLAFDCALTICAVVVGKGEDFTLVRVDANAPGLGTHASALEEFAIKGFQYCGTLGFVDGQAHARIAPENPGAAYTMCFAGLAFAHMVADQLRAQPKGDSVDWLTQLFQLPDART